MLRILMDFEPGPLLASLVVSGAGFVAFMYGKKQRRVPHMVVGIALMVYPYFVPDVLLMFVIGVVMFGLLWLAVRVGL